MNDTSVQRKKNRCPVCGKPLRYATQKEDCRELACCICGKKDLLNIYCPDNHYTCRNCHNAR